MRGRERRSDCCPRCRWTVSFEGHLAVGRCVAPVLAPQTLIQPTTSAGRHGSRNEIALADVASQLRWGI
jgi:hypothetical protein